eukprot:UN03492
MLSKTQLPFTKTLTDDEYNLAITQYKKDEPILSVSDISIELDIKIKVGIEFTMGNIFYIIEAIDEENHNIKCVQCGGNNDFPDAIYLKPNQLRNVTIIDDARSAPASPTSKDLVKMF